MIDQAGKLREIIHKKTPELKHPTLQPKVYSIISGKGGVGKTSVAVNLGISFSQMGKKVLILDADIGMSNANILLGEYVQYDIFDAIDEGKNFREILVKSEHGIDLLSGGSEFFKMETMDEAKQSQILHSLSVLEEYDIIIIDNGAGISRQSLAFTILGDEIILVTTPEPTAITDAYRVLKTISLHQIKNKVKVIINQAPDKAEGDIAFEKLRHTASQFLKLEIEKSGMILSDSRVNKAVMDQIPYVIKFPTSTASKCVMDIANTINGEEENPNPTNIFNRLSNRILKIFG